MSRQGVVWLLTLPLAVVGSQVGHSLAYRLATSGGEERAHALAETGHGYLAYAPGALAVWAVLVLVALGLELARAVGDRRPARPAALPFAVLAPALFVCQEHLERGLHEGAFPWSVAAEPAFLLGLALQLPFAAAGYLVARLLLRVARSLGRLLAAWRRARTRPSAQPRPPIRLTRSRVPALALGYGSRGPPPPSR
ncbi:MAG TPA: hypothetical protein VNJ46_00700 [Gaiellaceae bacterium]|nr:hypothetical protein [Gaiellaceae bacterium]